MRDPIDDLFATPDAAVNVFDALEADVAKAVAMAFFRAMHDSAHRALEAHLVGRGDDGDDAELIRYRTRVLQAINALEWVTTQQASEVRIGAYPVDLAAENALLDRMMANDSAFSDVTDADLGFPPDDDSGDFRRVLDEKLKELQDRKRDEDEA